MAVEKYVHIEGRVQIEIGKAPDTGEDALVLRFLNKDFDVVPGEPLYFYLNENGRPNPVKFRHVHLLGVFVEEGYNRVLETLRENDPISAKPWGELPDYNEDDMNGTAPKDDPDMNPSGPPKP